MAGRKPIIWTLKLKKDSVGDLTDSLAKEGVVHKIANWCVRTHFMNNPDLKGTGHTSNNDGLPHLNKTLKALKGTMNAKVIPVYAGILIDILNVRCYSEKKCFFFKDGQIVAHDLVKGVPRVSLKEYQVRLQKHLDHSKKHDGIILNDYNVTEECSESGYRIRVERNVPAKVSSNNFQFTHTKRNSSYSFIDVIPKRGRSSCAVDMEVQGVSLFIQSFPEQHHPEVRKMLILALSYQTYADGKRYCFYEEDGEIKYHEQVPGTPYPSQQDIAKELDKLVKKSGKEGILLTGKATEKCGKKEDVYSVYSSASSHGAFNILKNGENLWFNTPALEPDIAKTYKGKEQTVIHFCGDIQEYLDKAHEVMQTYLPKKFHTSFLLFLQNNIRYTCSLKEEIFTEVTSNGLVYSDSAPVDYFDRKSAWYTSREAFLNKYRCSDKNVELVADLPIPKKEKLPEITLELAKASTNGYLFEAILTIGNEASIYRRKPDAIFSETSFPANTSLPKFFSNDKKKLQKYPYSVQKQVREMLQDYLNYFSYLSSGLRISYGTDFEYSIKQETTLSVAECKRLRDRYKELTEASAKGKNGIQIYPKKD